MLISKFDLYNAEWLDLVFENRNKEYGAYDLRQNYASNLIRAMVISFLGIGILCGASLIFITHPPKLHVTVVDNTPFVIPPTIKAIKKIDPPKSSHLDAPKPAKPVAAIKDVPPVVTIDVKAVNPVKNSDALNATISTTDTKGPAGGGQPIPVDNPGNGTTIAPPDNSVHILSGVDVMPEPVGGDKAWAKFLSKNLRFPQAAQEEGLSGKVFLSFIIEKDGSLSNIVVERGAGHGFDEEAMRVLKLAKAWKPGMQNGQPVRVKYVIPINFQSSEQ